MVTAIFDTIFQFLGSKVPRKFILHRPTSIKIELIKKVTKTLYGDLYGDFCSAVSKK